MRVDLALFEGDVLLERGSIAVGAVSGCDHLNCFHVAHQLGRDSAKVVLSSFAPGVDLRTVTLDMPVHESADWETIDLDRYTLAFRCSLDAQPIVQADAPSARRST